MNLEDKKVMLGVPDDDSIEINEHRAMVCLPEDAVEVEINAKIFQDGLLFNVTKKLSMKDLREAFKKADDGYIDDDDTFAITEKGKAYLETLHSL